MGDIDGVEQRRAASSKSTDQKQKQKPTVEATSEEIEAEQLDEKVRKSTIVLFKN